MKNIFVFLLILFLVNINYGQSNIDNLGTRKHEIGYKSILLKDYSRNFGLSQAGKTYRPIQVNLWYPTTINSKKNYERMLFSNYLIIKSDLTKSFEGFTLEEKENILNKERQRLDKRGIASNKIDSLMKIRSASILNAKSIDKPFPLVIFNPSMLIHSVSNVRFCEYLASQGYIVASHASFGIEPGLMTTNYQDLNNQASDSEYIMNYLLNSEMNISRIGMIGHSWGGMASVLAASRNKNILSVISLDGSEEWWKEIIMDSPSFEITNFQTPYLRLALPNNVDFGFFNALQNDKIQIEFSDSILGHFSFVSRNVSANKNKEAYYKMICDISLHFFNRTLKSQESELTEFPFGMKEKYGSSMVSVLSAKKIDFPVKDQLLSMILSGQINNVLEIINANKNKLSYKYLIEIGEYILWSWNFPKESEKYFLTIIKMFPEFYQGYEMLGHVYSGLLKNNDKALINYSKALKLSGGNKRLEQTIKELKE